MTLGRRGHVHRCGRGHALEPPRVLRHGDRRKAHGTGRGEQRDERCVAFMRHPSHDTVPPLLDHHQK